MKTKEIIGYNLKKKQYEEAAVRIVETSKQFGQIQNHITFKQMDDPQEGCLFQANSFCAQKLKEAGVLDLWFTPVYKEDPQPANDTWYISTFGNLVFYNRRSEKWLYGINGLKGQVKEFNLSAIEKKDFIDNLNEYWKPATDQEVLIELDRIRENLGIVEGVYINPLCPMWATDLKLRRLECEEKAGFNLLHFKSEVNELIYLGRLIFKNGKWAEIIPSKEVKLNEQCTATIRNGKVELAGYEFTFRSMKYLQKAIRKYQVETEISQQCK